MGYLMLVIEMIYNIRPVPKPRMTQRDKWAKRPPVLRYIAFKNECKLHKVKFHESGSHVIFYIEMPKSWTLKKKEKMNGEPHQQRPDVDNLLKALMDAVYGEDCTVYDIRVSKIWHFQPGIEVKYIN